MAVNTQTSRLTTLMPPTHQSSTIPKETTVANSQAIPMTPTVLAIHTVDSAISILPTPSTIPTVRATNTLQTVPIIHTEADGALKTERAPTTTASKVAEGVNGLRHRQDKV